MSTKIYNGFTVGSLRKADFKDVFAWTKEVREVMLEEYISAFRKMYIRQAVRKYDLALSYKKHPEWPKMFGYDDIKDEFCNQFAEKCCLILYSHERSVYGQHFLGCSSMEKIFFEKFPEVSDFHYQNQSDPGEDVSEDDWEIREKIWNELLPGAGVPVENGLSVHIASSDDIISNLWCRNNLNEVYKADSLSKAERVAFMVEEHQQDMREKELFDTPGTHLEWWSRYNKIKKDLKENPYSQKVIDNLTKQIEAVLPEVYTVELMDHYRDTYKPS